jgi:hypothetical protein
MFQISSSTRPAPYRNRGPAIKCYQGSAGEPCERGNNHNDRTRPAPEIQLRQGAGAGRQQRHEHSRAVLQLPVLAQPQVRRPQRARQQPRRQLQPVDLAQQLRDGAAQEGAQYRAPLLRLDLVAPAPAPASTAGRSRRRDARKSAALRVLEGSRRILSSEERLAGL